MKKVMVTSCAAVAAICAFAAEPAATVFVAVDPMKELGAVKPMHAVNNGPSVKKPGGDQKNVRRRGSDPCDTVDVIRSRAFMV